MKTTWVIAAALLLVAAGAMDASARGRGGKHGFNGHAKDGGYTKRGGYTKDGGYTKRSGYTSLSDSLGLTEDQQAQIDALQEQGLTGYGFLISLATILTEDQIAALDETGLGKYGFGKHGFGKHGFGKHGFGKYGFGCYSKDSEEETETAAAGKATAVEETSWGRVKDSFGR